MGSASKTDEFEVTEEMLVAGMRYLDGRVDFCGPLDVSELRAVYIAMRLVEFSNPPEVCDVEYDIG
jgi:hypothetical protein